jgi:hypothetical protein
MGSKVIYRYHQSVDCGDGSIHAVHNKPGQFVDTNTFNIAHAVLKVLRSEHKNVERSV